MRSPCFRNRDCFKIVETKSADTQLDLESPIFISSIRCKDCDQQRDTCADKFKIQLGLENLWPTNKAQHQRFIAEIQKYKTRALEILCDGCVIYFTCTCYRHNQDPLFVYIRHYLFE